MIAWILLKQNNEIREAERQRSRPREIFTTAGELIHNKG